MSTKTTPSNPFQRVVKILLVTVALACIPLCLYFVVFRFVDHAICIPVAAERINVDPNYTAIREYIYESLKPGITRQDVEQILEKIGTVEVEVGQEALDNRVADSIWLKICQHPLNNILIFTRYTLDGKLVTAYINDD